MPARGEEQPAALGVADQFFLLCHSHDGEITKPRLHDWGIDLGLASALLAELIIDRGIDIRDGWVVPLNPRAPTDSLALATLRDVVRESRHDVRTWLEYLGQTARDKVGSRLYTKGILTMAKKRGLLPRSPRHRYQTVDPHFALKPEVRLHSLFSGQYNGRGTTALEDVTVAMLTDVTGLLNSLVWAEDARRAKARVDRLRRGLPHPVLELIRHTEAAVATATISHRR